MKFRQFTTIAALFLLVSPEIFGATSNTRVFTFNTAPSAEIISSNLKWVPPLVEPGSLQVTNTAGGLFLKPLAGGGFAKAFSFSAAIRLHSTSGNFAVNFVPENLWHHRALTLSSSALVAANSNGLSFLFSNSTSGLRVQVGYGTVHTSAMAMAQPTNTWFTLEVAHDEFGRVTVAIDGVMVIDHVQLAFPPISGRVLFICDAPLDIRQIENTLLPADLPLIQRVFATPYAISLLTSVRADRSRKYFSKGRWFDSAARGNFPWRL